MARYSNISKTKAPDGERMYTTVRYPEIPRSENDIYVYTTIGDRFDTLALQYYGDSSLWWVISIANNSFNQGSYFITPGVQLRIPSQIGSIIASYNELNDY